MHQQFICVFSAGERDILLDNQFTLLFSDDRNGVYIFVNPADKNDTQAEALDSVGYLLTNELLF